MINRYLSEKGGLRPVKELKGFHKVNLQPGESAQVTFTLDKRSFSYFNTEISDWFAETGAYKLLAGPSSAETPLAATVNVISTGIPFQKVTRNTRFYELLAIPETAKFAEKAMNESVEQMKQMGAMFSESTGDDSLVELFEAVVRMMKYGNLRSMSGSILPNDMTEEKLEEIIVELNRKLGLV